MTKPLAPLGPGRYAFLLFDSTFKVVVCNPENEKLLIEILELLLPGKKISHIYYTNKENHGLVVSEKNVIFDMLCTDAKTGEEFLVELQNAPQSSFQDRVLTYATYPIREQTALRLARIRNGENLDRMDYSLKPVYVISLINFSLEHESTEALEDGYICRYELRNRHNAELMTPALNFVFVEMGRLDLKANEPDKCRTLLEKFIFSLKYMHLMKEPPAGFTDPLLDRLYKATELASMTIATREFYDHNMRTELDIIAERDYARRVAIADGRAEGRAEGLAKGRAEGLAQGKAEGLAQGKAEGLAQGKAEGLAQGKAEANAFVAKQLLASGVDMSIIMAATGLSEEQIRAL